jgi:hypothetical protein
LFAPNPQSQDRQGRRRHGEERWRRDLAGGMGDLATATTDPGAASCRRPHLPEPQAGCSGLSSAWAHHAHDTYPPARRNNDKVERRWSRVPALRWGKEEPSRKEGRAVGWPAMLGSCSMRPPAGGVDGEPSRGVGEEAERKRERWHGTQREKAVGLMPCPDGEKRTRWSFFMSTDREKGGGMMLCVFFFFRK